MYEEMSTQDIITSLGLPQFQLEEATLEYLTQKPGIGVKKAETVLKCIELGKRLTRPRENLSRITSPNHVFCLMHQDFIGKEQEEMWVILLNRRNGLIDKIMVSRGLVDRSYVHAREVFKHAIRRNASTIILSHNHPSGDLTPSPGDIKCTKALVEAGKIIGIDVMDHVIIAPQSTGRKHVSFREENLIEMSKIED